MVAAKKTAKKKAAKKAAAEKTVPEVPEAAPEVPDPPVVVHDPRVPTIDQMNDPEKALEGLVYLLQQQQPDLPHDLLKARAEELFSRPLVPPSP